MNDVEQGKHNTKLASAIVVLIGLYLISTSAFYPLGFLSPFDAKRILQLVLFSGFALFALSWAPLRLQTMQQLSRLPRFSQILLGLFFVLGIVSSLRLAHPGYALADVAMLFLLVSMIAIVAASRDLAPASFDKCAVASLSVMGLFVFIQELMGFISGWVLGTEFSYARALIHFGHPRFFNQLQTWSIPIIAALPIVFPKKVWLKPACVVLLGFQWFMVIALAARGTAVSLVLAALFVALWLPNARKYWLKTHILGVLAGFAIYLGFLFLNSLFIPQSDSGAFYSNSAGREMMHTSGRSKFWKHSISDVTKNPLLGSGPSHYSCDSEVWLPAHAHSFPMQLLGEWGFPATILFLTAGLMLGVRNLKELKATDDGRPPTSILKAVLAVSVLAGAIHACLSGLVVMPASQMSLVLVAGWVLSASTIIQPKGQQFRIQLATIVASVLIALSVFIFSVHEQTHFFSRTSNLEKSGRMVPRFWQDGRVCEYTYDEI